MSVKVSWRKDRERWQVEYHLDGQRKRPLFRERTKADDHARKIRLGLKPEDRECISIFDAGQKYFHAESVRKNPKSRTNDKRYINLLFHFMTYERGIERLNSIELEDMEAFRLWLESTKEFDDKPMDMGPSSINRCLRVLKRFFLKFIHWKEITENPCQYLEYLDSVENPRPVMTGPQHVLTLEQCPDYLKPVVRFMYLTGSPASVIARLKWSDIDFERGAMTVTRKKGRKAQTIRTQVPVAQDTLALLAMLRDLWPQFEGGAVFRDANGRPLLADRITREGNEARVRAGVGDGVTLYGLRHGLASDMTAANVATEIVRQALAHRSITTTQNYANKVSLKIVSGALESVRGGDLVATDKNGLRQQGAGF